jgi:ABC-type Fe3+/spermidine/putrescine transport system ATPase subunit
MTEKLVLTGLTKRYGNHLAVDGLELQVKEGDFISFLGPSGSGKTTVLNMIAGLVEPTSGGIMIDGVDLTHQPANQRNIGLVFQNYALFPHLTVSGNIAFPLEVRGHPPETIGQKVEETLRLVKLEGFGERLPSELSGGQQQRVALARAIVFEPSLLLLDEPLGALDRRLRESLRQELRSLQRATGITTIMVTHDQEEALTMSDQVLVMAGGRAEQIGSPEDLYQRPRNRFVAEFMGSSNIVAGTSLTKDGKTFLQIGKAAVPRNGEAASDGRAMQFAVRPDAVGFDADGLGPSALVGTVVGSEFCGEYYRLHIETDDLGVLASHIRTNTPPAIGTQGVLTWSAADMHQLSDDG